MHTTQASSVQGKVRGYLLEKGVGEDDKDTKIDCNVKWQAVNKDIAVEVTPGKGIRPFPVLLRERQGEYVPWSVQRLMGSGSGQLSRWARGCMR